MKIYVLFGAVIALLAADVYLFLQVDGLRTETSRIREVLEKEITNVRESSSVTSATNRKHLDSIREELEAARRQAAAAVGRARTEALSHADQLAKKLAEEQQKQQQQVAGEITEVKQAATTANAKIADVKSDVSSVKTEVASTRSELERTIADLKRVTGDLGVQSGLIATNGRELAALREFGERNYFEFNLTKSKQPQRVGTISLLLKKTDTKRNKYSIELVADDKKVEKSDKNINEPVQFYVAKARQPYEIVVNEVKKDQIVGYLATPKVEAVR